MKPLQWIWAYALVVVAFAFVSGVMFLLLVVLAGPVRAAELECSVKQGEQVISFIAAHSKAPLITMELNNARRFMVEMKAATKGRAVNYPTPFKLVFIGVELDKGWLVFVYGEPKDGKDCVFGMFGVATDLLALMVKKIQDSEI